METIKSCLYLAQQKLKNIESGDKITQILLSAILGVDQSYLWAHPDQQISTDQYRRFFDTISRASKHEPIAYILGYADFYGWRFTVDNRVLIPRPETEALVEQVLQKVHSNLPTSDHIPIIVDVGTGSGCVALSIAKHLSQAQVLAIDISAEALAVAKTNACQLHISTVTFMQGNLLEPLLGHLEFGTVDVVVANLPYISDDEFKHLPPNIRNYEPALALRSGSDPDSLNRQLADQTKIWLRPGGFLAYETTNGQILQA